MNPDHILIQMQGRGRGTVDLIQGTFTQISITDQRTRSPSKARSIRRVLTSPHHPSSHKHDMPSSNHHLKSRSRSSSRHWNKSRTRKRRHEILITLSFKVSEKTEAQQIAFKGHFNKQTSFPFKNTITFKNKRESQLHILWKLFKGYCGQQISLNIRIPITFPFT